MSGLGTISFEAPEEVLDFEKCRMELVTRPGGVRVWRCTFEPGWRFRDHVDPGGCPAPHLAYLASGALGVEMDDGTAGEARPGSVVVIEPGHDAWTIGEEPCVFIDFAESVGAEIGAPAPAP
jgi:quercetin dioxygenase-like cupin family protein